MSDPSAPTEKDKKKDSPGQIIFGGLFLIAIGIGFFLWFYYAEQNGGGVESHVIIIFIYQMLGKWGVLGIFGGLGVLLMWFGIREWRKEREEKSLKNVSAAEISAPRK